MRTALRAPELLTCLPAAVRPTSGGNGRPAAPLRGCETPSLARDPKLREMSEVRRRRALIQAQALRARRRSFRDCYSGYRYVSRLLAAAVADVGRDVARCLFLGAELEYWTTRCEPGLVQSLRQQRENIGWINVEHYVFACSRQHYHSLYALLAGLDYQATSVLKASGAVAAVTFEVEHHPRHRLVVEVAGAIEEYDLLMRGGPLWSPYFGRSGLWCGLHGDSLLDGGLAHIAAAYDCEQLRRLFVLDGYDVHIINDRHGITQLVVPGRLMAVAPYRVDTLERQGRLCRDDAERLRTHGAVSAQLHAIDKRECHAVWQLPLSFDGLEAMLARRSEASPSPRRRLRRRTLSTRGGIAGA